MTDEIGHYRCETQTATAGERLVDKLDRRLVAQFGKRETPSVWIEMDGEHEDVDEIDGRD